MSVSLPSPPAPAAPAWRRSSHSGGAGNCVEIATVCPDVVGVRDSKNSEGPVLLFSRGGFTPFLAALQAEAPVMR
ncbi:DUF397 domain-containing protein [Streptomyces sp. NPDC055078]